MAPRGVRPIRSLDAKVLPARTPHWQDRRPCWHIGRRFCCSSGSSRRWEHCGYGRDRRRTSGDRALSGGQRCDDRPQGNAARSGVVANPGDGGPSRQHGWPRQSSTLLATTLAAILLAATILAWGFPPARPITADEVESLFAVAGQFTRPPILDRVGATYASRACAQSREATREAVARAATCRHGDRSTVLAILRNCRWDRLGDDQGDHRVKAPEASSFIVFD